MTASASSAATTELCDLARQSKFILVDNPATSGKLPSWVAFRSFRYGSARASVSKSWTPWRWVPVVSISLGHAALALEDG